MDYQLGPGPLQVDQNTIDEKIKGDIGIVENGDVATHAIPSGYYVIWKGDLYIAKTDISSGTTLNTSNLTAKPNGIGAEVTGLKSGITLLNSKIGNVGNTDLQAQVTSLNSNMPSNYFLLSNGGTKILANANLNNYTTAGCYYVEFASDAASIQNIPFATAGVLFVRNTIPVSGRNYKQQIFLPFSTDDAYKRHTMDNGGTWSEWKDDVKGTSTALGSHQGTGTFNLSQSVKNFSSVYIQIGYYQSGYPQYGQALVPVSRLAFNSEATYGIRIITVDSTAGSCTIIFPSETSCQVIAMQNNNWYVALYGIK